MRLKDASVGLVCAAVVLGLVGGQSAADGSPRTRELAAWLKRSRSTGDVGAKSPIEIPSGMIHAHQGGPRDQNPVVGTRVIHYFTDSGVVDVPQDLTSTLIGAWVGDSTVGFTFYRGVGQSDGTFAIDDVPMGPYLLVFNSTYLATSARALDLGFYTQGRPDVAYARSGTFLELDLQGLNPWNDDDDIEVYSSNAGMWIASPQAYDVNGGYPNFGDTSSSSLLDYSTYFDPRLADAGKGDKTTVHQLVTEASGPGIHLAAAGKSATSSTLTIADGQFTPFAATLVDVPQDQNWSFTWSFSSFHNYAGAIHPTARSLNDELFLDVIPQDLSFGAVGNSPDLVEIFVDPGTLDQAVNVSYGDPYPSTWSPPFALAYSLFSVPFALPGATRSGFTALFYTEDAVATFPNPVQLQLSPPQALQVNGQSAVAGLSGITTTPTVSWSAPAVGTATFYTVRVYELYVDASNRTRRVYRAGLNTNDTSFTIPPSLLDPTKTYFFDVVGQSENRDIQQAPFMYSLPSSSAEAFTGILTP